MSNVNMYLKYTCTMYLSTFLLRYDIFLFTKYTVFICSKTRLQRIFAIFYIQYFINIIYIIKLFPILGKLNRPNSLFPFSYGAHIWDIFICSIFVGF